MIDKEKLLYLIAESKKVVEEVCGDICPVLDSANFQTKSKEDFERIAEKFENGDLKFLLEVNHAGRRIQVFDVMDKAMGLNFVELTEPKPSSKLAKNEWEYVSYVSDHYDQCLEKFSSSKYKVKKIRKVAGSRHFYMETPNVLIQVRSRSVGEMVQGDEEVGTDSEKMPSEDESVQTEELDYKEKYAKLMADFENYRRVQEQQAVQTTVNSRLRLFTELVEVLDDFERAIAAHPEASNGGVDGFRAIYDKVRLILKENGVEEVAVNVGGQFNSSNMEAVTTVSTPDQAKDNTVQEVLQKGYVHKESGKVVRMPRVVVAKFQG